MYWSCHLIAGATVEKSFRLLLLFSYSQSQLRLMPGVRQLSGYCTTTSKHGQQVSVLTNHSTNDMTEWMTLSVLISAPNCNTHKHRHLLLDLVSVGSHRPSYYSNDSDTYLSRESWDCGYAGRKPNTSDAIWRSSWFGAHQNLKSFARNRARLNNSTLSVYKGELIAPWWENIKHIICIEKCHKMDVKCANLGYLPVPLILIG